MHASGDVGVGVTVIDLDMASASLGDPLTYVTRVMEQGLPGKLEATASTTLGGAPAREAVSSFELEQRPAKQWFVFAIHDTRLYGFTYFASPPSAFAPHRTEAEAIRASFRFPGAPQP